MKYLNPRVDIVDGSQLEGVDVIGDIHGAMDEMLALGERLGYEIELPEDLNLPARVAPPEGRKLFLVGDLTDRGPRSVDALRLAEGLIASETGGVVMGNHDWKLLRYLDGGPVIARHALEGTLEEFDTRELTPERRASFREMLRGLPHQIRIDFDRPMEGVPSGSLTIVHAAAPEQYLDLASRNAFERSIYGYPDGEDEYGHVRRKDWAADYAGSRTVVHGHTPLPQPSRKNGVICIDTAAVFGNKLTAWQSDTDAFVYEASRTAYAERKGFRDGPARRAEPADAER